MVVGIGFGILDMVTAGTDGEDGLEVVVVVLVVAVVDFLTRATRLARRFLERFLDSCLSDLKFICWVASLHFNGINLFFVF